MISTYLRRIGTHSLLLFASACSGGGGASVGTLGHGPAVAAPCTPNQAVASGCSGAKVTSCKEGLGVLESDCAASGKVCTEKAQGGVTVANCSEPPSGGGAPGGRATVKPNSSQCLQAAAAANADPKPYASKRNWFCYGNALYGTCKSKDCADEPGHCGGDGLDFPTQCLGNLDDPDTDCTLLPGCKPASSLLDEQCCPSPTLNLNAVGPKFHTCEEGPCGDSQSSIAQYDYKCTTGSEGSVMLVPAAPTCGWQGDGTVSATNLVVADALTDPKPTTAMLATFNLEGYFGGLTAATSQSQSCMSPKPNDPWIHMGGKMTLPIKAVDGTWMSVEVADCAWLCSECDAYWPGPSYSATLGGAFYCDRVFPDGSSCTLKGGFSLAGCLGAAYCTQVNYGGGSSAGADAGKTDGGSGGSDGGAAADAGSTGNSDAGSTGAKPSIAQVSAYTVRVSACWGGGVGSRWTGPAKKASLNLPKFATELACVLAAKDCKGVVTCLGEDPSAPCDGSKLSPQCSGSVATACFSHSNGTAFLTKLDCKSNPLGNTNCAVAGSDAICIGEPCNSSDQSYCKDGVARFCSSVSDGAPLTWRAHDCTADGLSCNTEGGSASCTANGATCQSAGCAGKQVVNCELGHTIPQQDCGWLGADVSCFAGKDSAKPYCAVSQPECDPTLPSFGGCAGSKAVACVAGKTMYFDCAAFGATCSLDSPTGARCKRPDWP